MFFSSFLFCNYCSQSISTILTISPPTNSEEWILSHVWYQDSMASLRAIANPNLYLHWISLFLYIHISLYSYVCHRHTETDNGKITPYWLADSGSLLATGMSFLWLFLFFSPLYKDVLFMSLLYDIIASFIKHGTFSPAISPLSHSQTFQTGGRGWGYAESRRNNV